LKSGLDRLSTLCTLFSVKA